MRNSSKNGWTEWRVTHLLMLVCGSWFKKVWITSKFQIFSKDVNEMYSLMLLQVGCTTGEFLTLIPLYICFINVSTWHGVISSPCPYNSINPLQPHKNIIKKNEWKQVLVSPTRSSFIVCFFFYGARCYKCLDSLFWSVRNAVAMFLTRGDLWLHWEKGADHLMNHLVDCDWSVNSGNWMWVSSSAFERLLDCSVCINSVSYGKRLEPSGNFIRRFVPELANFPFEYIHEPWKAPIEAQQAANCLIGIQLLRELKIICLSIAQCLVTWKHRSWFQSLAGKDYPARMVIHEEVSRRNREHMVAIREKIVAKCQGSAPPHCKPSSENEVYQFFCITENCLHV